MQEIGNSERLGASVTRCLIPKPNLNIYSFIPVSVLNYLEQMRWNRPSFIATFP
ncbi:hypothetical protein [Candidatus Chlorohelix sp.]|uniref:hypothetical protein n=1 Tax=Candidatus Chlorohelix sp. TaxID=3139201 RepID=UPI0031454F0E